MVVQVVCFLTSPVMDSRKRLMNSSYSTEVCLLEIYTKLMLEPDERP